MSERNGTAAAKVSKKEIEAQYRAHSRRVFATLIRLLGGFDLAEEALHDAFLAAVEQWPARGVPANPYSWLVSAGRFKAIDNLRRRSRFDASLGELAEQSAGGQTVEPEAIVDEGTIRDDELRMIFICCHPALPADAQVAMALREICGLTTEEIARAFLVPTPTIAQRIVRAKSRIREQQLPYAMPEPAEYAERLDSVLQVVYLIFNEGYSASAGIEAVRANLAAEAIRLGRLLAELVPDPEILGLLALMLLHHSRRNARTDEHGALILFEDQDRSKWDREMITEGQELLARIMAGRVIGVFALQAAIAAEHARAEDPERTDWPEIVRLYDLLLTAEPSPVAELNRAVAVSHCDGPEAGLALVQAILGRGDLSRYAPAHLALADCLRRLGRTDDARVAYEIALSLTHQEPERAFIRGRIADPGGS